MVLEGVPALQAMKSTIQHKNSIKPGQLVKHACLDVVCYFNRHGHFIVLRSNTTLQSLEIGAYYTSADNAMFQQINWSPFNDALVLENA